ncbi:MAG: T9SS type A sorting domain-containing protein, partial [Bacteroidota bacterium]
NIGYWSRMVKLGYVTPNPRVEIPKGKFTGTKIIEYINPSFPVTRHASRVTLSPDLPVTSETDVTQSENSVFIDPSDESVTLNSNNSSSWTSGYADQAYGADALFSLDGGQDWQGSTRGTSGTNNGDPSTAIGLNGWWYVGRISEDWGQAVSYSKDQGKSWTSVKVGQGPTAAFSVLDKNHLWIDPSPGSPFAGYLYDGWTNQIPGSADTNQIEIVRSADHGLTWSSPYNISSAVVAGSLNHGVNIQTGPGGEVYAAWSIYDTWPSDETAIGFTKSVDGGGIFTPATRIITNIKGIRASMTGKNMRVNSFPSMAVDLSTGPNRGTLYLVWANVGYPGINAGTDIDVFLIRSADEGDTWSDPIRVNQDPAGLGKQHYFPWITCDPITGGLCVIYYDDRDLPSTQAATYVSFSYDGGLSWSDMQVSDFTFTPKPIAGLAYSYFGDYIGIQSRNMKVYPMWTDNHDGRAMTYVSPFDLGPNPNQPWVSYYSNALTPAAGGGTTTLNYGDSLHLSLGLKNIGDQMAGDVTAYLYSTSPWIHMTDSIAFYDTIGPGQVRVIPNGFAFKVSDTIPDNLPVRFEVRVTGSDSVWYSHFAIESHAPALKINSLVIADTNGRLDPGETVTMVITVSNTGDFDAPMAVGRLTTTSPWLTLLTDPVFLDTLHPGEVKEAEYMVTVSPDAPTGTGADLTLTVQSGLYIARRTFREMIGRLIEDWETNTLTRFAWQTAGSAPWVVTNQDPWEGLYCVRSGAIPSYENSQLFLDYTSAASDSISFWLSTSSEQDYDFLNFYIDDVLLGQWSGDTPWRRAAYPVDAGEHTFKWSYNKDIALSWGLDRAWVDFIALPPPILPIVDPGPDDTLCAGMNAMLNGTAEHYDSIRWGTSGDGLFGNDTLLSTLYTPGTNDLIEGSVNLRLTGWGLYGSFGRNKVIRIHPLPVASFTIYPRDTVCAGQPVILSADTTGNTAYLWTPGYLTLPEISFDTSITGGVGRYLVRLTVTNRFQCQNRDSAFVTFRDCTGMEEQEPASLLIYPNPGDGRFILELHTLNPGPGSINVTSSTGVVVFSEKYSFIPVYWNKELNLAYLPEGIYVLSLTTGEEKRMYKLVFRR